MAAALSGTLGAALPGLVDGSLRLDAAQAGERAAGLAGWLRARGVGPGDVVAFDAPPSAAAAMAYGACWVLGATAAPLHHRLTPVERDRLLARLAPRVVLPAGALPSDAPVAAAPADPDAVAVLLATSGSSGRPKLVRHTYRALSGKAAAMVGVHEVGPDDTVLMPAPMAHVSGLLNGVLLPAAAGMRTVCMPRWDPDRAVRLIAAERVSFMVGPPTLFLQLAAAPSFAPDRVASLRLLSCGGAGVTEAFCRDATAIFGARVKRSYGSTEAPTVATSYAADPEELGWTTDGRAVGDAQLRIGLDGELEVRGPELFAGYDDPAQTAAAFTADGWFRTGDRARLDGDRLTVLGRFGDLLIRAGENVDPAEVAAVCATLPGVRDAVVVGYPDDVLGERVGLVVTPGPAPSLEAVRAHCAAAGLARYKTPERVVAVEALPVLTVGKPDRAALRELLGR